MIIYGIPNCNTVKKSLDWMKEHHIEFSFHDFKKKGVDEDKLTQWISVLGWETLLNKKGTTWRKLSIDEQQKVTDERSAIQLMVDKPSIIKRPVIEFNHQLLTGFDPKIYEEKFLPES